MTKHQVLADIRTPERMSIIDFRYERQVKNKREFFAEQSFTRGLLQKMS